MDQAAVPAECGRGEEVAQRRYENALSKDLPADVRSIVERQYDGSGTIRSAHEIEVLHDIEFCTRIYCSASGSIRT
jgi:uncharacterized protein (TIGR02284 family)